VGTVRPELVVQVAYDICRAPVSVIWRSSRRWRTDKTPRGLHLRALEVIPPHELKGYFRR